MRNVVSTALLLLWTSPLAAQKIDFKKLEFMSGCWLGQTGQDAYVQETWSQPNDSLVLGYTQYLTNDKPTNFDFNYIRRTDSTVILVLSPHGQPSDTFSLKQLADEVVSWERGGTRFPGVVMYRKTANGDIIARLEPPPTVTQTSVEVRFRRMKCPGQK